MKSKPIRLKFSSKKVESPEKIITNIEINYSPVSIHDSQSKIKVKHKEKSEVLNLKCSLEPADDTNILQSSIVLSSDTNEKCNIIKESDGFFQFLCASCESNFKEKLANQKIAQHEIEEQILSLSESKKNICKVDELHEMVRKSSEDKTHVLNKLCKCDEDKKQQDQLLHSSSITAADDLTKNPNSTLPEQPPVKLSTWMEDKETQVGIGFVKRFTDTPSTGFSPNSRFYTPVNWKRINTIPRRSPWR